MVIRKQRDRGDGITNRTEAHRSAETASEAVAALDEYDAALADPLASLRLGIAWAETTFSDWLAANPGVDRGDETIPDLQLQLIYTGEEMERSLIEGKAERAAAMAAGAGRLLTLLKVKHNVEPKWKHGQKFVGGPKGERERTAKRKAFLREIAATIGTDKREAVAAQAVGNHKTKVKRLWATEGVSARDKILNFMRNNGM